MRIAERGRRGRTLGDNGGGVYVRVGECREEGPGGRWGCTCGDVGWVLGVGGTLRGGGGVTWG